MAKRYAIYTVVEKDERFLGQAYLTEKDLEIIERSFEGENQAEYMITLTDGDTVEVKRIDSIEELQAEEED